MKEATYIHTYKKPCHESGLCNSSYARYLEKRLTQIYKVLYGDAMFVSISGAQIWPPESKRNICFWVFLLGEQWWRAQWWEHQCGPGSNPGVDAICGLSLLLVLSFAPRGFSPGTPIFPSPQKPRFPNSNSTRNQVDEEPLCGCATCKSLFIYFIYLCVNSSLEVLIKIKALIFILRLGMFR